jgi:hypothetical protein
VTDYRLRAAPRVDLDVAAAHQWYETEHAGLGAQFLAELNASYNRYQDLGFGIRRARRVAAPARLTAVSARALDVKNAHPDGGQP